MRALVMIAMACLAALPAASAPASRGEPAGTWTGALRENGRELQLNLRTRGDGGGQWGEGVPVAELRGFTGPDGEAHFSLAREAGTAYFDGMFRDGEGAGHVRFEQASGYLESMRRLGYPEAAREKPLLLALLDVGPRRARGYQGIGFKHLSWDDFFAFCIHGVTPAYVKEMRALELPMTDPERVTAMRIHGVTPAFVREVRQAGLGGADEVSLTELRIHGVTAEYAREMRSLGLGDLDAEQLKEMRIHGVTPEFVQEMRGRGFTKATADDFVRLRIHGVDDLLRGRKGKKGKRADD